jgi:hypothetical protein
MIKYSFQKRPVFLKNQSAGDAFQKITLHRRIADEGFY